ncbi:hypothetical protein MIND_01198400 [Mycena indigotica]|uniref:Uncharacterized protein n=1 Tax=Mycena indigotica TaxID=2126181 RepID=A0A8H6S6I4_9AGAR|nr:uncharacterized protein MIND_01198400 [Mycena indigotica]KAF7292991.1 hypothetical protein MIND_01198400 [Mycena indigotica]
MSEAAATPTVKEHLATSFDKSASAVRAYTDQFEKDYARPALHSATTYFEEFPITSTFVAVFASLSFVPVVTFLVFSLFFVLSIAVVALSSALLLTSTVVLFFLSILLLSLCVTFFFAGCITLTLLSTYVTYRLLILVRADGREGVSTWAAETKSRFAYPRQRRRKEVLREASDGSDSAVVVESDPETTKAEPETFDSDVTIKPEVQGPE